MAPDPAVEAVVFDLGGVLVDWNPRHLYRKIFGERERDMERFLAEVATMEFNHRLDRGQPFADAVAALQRDHPECTELIAAYDDRWEEMFAGEVPGTPALLARVRAGGQAVYVLTNSPAEKFDRIVGRFPFLADVDGLLVSGAVNLAKPEPEIFRLLCERFSLDAPRTLFIDDVPANVAAAQAVGLQAVVFRSAAELEEELAARGVRMG